MTKILKRLTLTVVLAALCMVSVLTGCKPKTEEVTINLNPTSAELFIGESLTLEAEASDGSSVKWSSSDMKIATVGTSGEVKARAEGQAVITATSGTAYAECTVTVKHVENRTEYTFRCGVNSSSYHEGDEISLTPVFKKGTANLTSAVKVNYSSSNESIAIVENGVLKCLKTGTVTITALCTFNGEEYKSEKDITVEALTLHANLAKADGTVVDGALMLVNGESLSDQLYIKYFDENGINVCPITFTGVAEGIASYSMQSGTKNGSVRISLSQDGNSVIDTNGIISCEKADEMTTEAQLKSLEITVGEDKFDGTEGVEKVYIRNAQTYTDFVEMDDEKVYGYFSYDAAAAGAAINIDDKVTYNGAPSLKVTVPINYSYLRFSDIINNYKDYGITVGSRISMYMLLDGQPKDPTTNYYTIGKISSVNGASYTKDVSSICSYAEARARVNAEKQQWNKVTYVLSEENFPLVDMGITIGGNGTSNERYIYLAAFTIENPDNVDYTLNFANSVEWKNTGKNQNVDWWGYAPTTKDFEFEKLPSEISAAYSQTFDGKPSASALVLSPSLPMDIFKLDNISCEVNRTLIKAIVSSGATQYKMRVYVEASGDIPDNTDIGAIIFMRVGSDSAPGFAQSNIKTVHMGQWVELSYDIPAEYMECTHFTVAFNISNYVQKSAKLKIYIDRLFIG